MIGAVKGSVLLEGGIRRKKGDASALADTIVKFSQMMAELQGLLQGVDLSLMVLPEGQGVKVTGASIRWSQRRH
jgi:hypothetical protein